MPLSFDAKTVVPPDVLVRELQGESVLLNLKSGAYFGLDDVGTRMWALLTASPTIRAAYDALLEEFDVTPDRLQEDLDAFVEKLRDQGLIEVTSA